MKSQPTATLARREPTMPPDGGHQHTSACFWHADECRWHCVTSPEVGNALERRPTSGRQVKHTASEIRPYRKPAIPDSFVRRPESHGLRLRPRQRLSLSSAADRPPVG